MVETSRVLADTVYEVVRKSIKEGHYQGGMRLRERDIATELSVSRTPVREALQRLIHRGLLELAPGGPIVRKLSQNQTLELYSSREVLEGGIARLAAQHASLSEISNLRRLSLNFSKVGDLVAMTEANRTLHAAFYEAAHNVYLRDLVVNLNDSLALLPHSTFQVEGRFEAAVKEHSAIVEAIADRDPVVAEACARDHIRRSTEARLQLPQRL